VRVRACPDRTSSLEQHHLPRKDEIACLEAVEVNVSSMVIKTSLIPDLLYNYSGGSDTRLLGECVLNATVFKSLLDFPNAVLKLVFIKNERS